MSGLDPAVESQILSQLEEAHFSTTVKDGQTASSPPPSRDKVASMIQGCASLIFPDCYPSLGASPLRLVADQLQELTLAALKMDHWERKTNCARAVPQSSSRRKSSSPEASTGSLDQLLVEGSANVGHTTRYSSEFCPRHGVEAPLRRPLEIPLHVGFFSPQEKGTSSTQEAAYQKLVHDLVVVPFLKSIPSEIVPQLHSDVDATLEKDVATKSRVEVILCYPGITGLLHQRIAHKLHRLGVPLLLSRLITEVGHCLTGIDIHPATCIGNRLFIDHGTGIVVGATAEIGCNVSIYQGVCLGAMSFRRDLTTGLRLKHLLRHPVVEDGVTLYSHATVLGRVTLGAGATLGGNVWCTSDVAPKEVLYQGKASTSTGIQGTPLDEHEEGGGI